MRPSSKLLRGLTLTAVVMLLAGCSEYLDRREAISLNAGDAVATDRVTMMVDPWPRASADKNIAFNGERMQKAVARYRTNKVTSPKVDGTSTTYQASDAPEAAQEGAAPKPIGPTITITNSK
jgi:hypothetical protein